MLTLGGVSPRLAVPPDAKHAVLVKPRDVGGAALGPAYLFGAFSGTLGKIYLTFYICLIFNRGHLLKRLRLLMLLLLLQLL